MDVLLLGTGAADGWPNAFCRCPSCADQRARGAQRRPTCALVDGRLLLDCGPAAPVNATRFGVDLAEVDAVLVTHAHSDHLDPTFLLHRSWVTDRPLTVYGPPPVVASCRLWLAPDQTAVRLVEVTAGDALELSGYRVDVLPAAHEAFGEAVLYRVQDAGAALLYATDTGPWAPGTLEALAGTALDLVLLEETFGDRADLATGHHHHFGSFAQALDDLRAAGCLTEGSRAAAVHLSHHNPPLHALTERLAAMGAEVHPDGTLLRLASAEERRPHHGVQHQGVEGEEHGADDGPPAAG